MPEDKQAPRLQKLPQNPRPDGVPKVLTQLDISLEGEEKIGSLWEWRRENAVWCPRESPPPAHDALGQTPTLMSLWIFP